MIDKSKLEEYANKLMFAMKEEEYLTLQKEFDIILKQMDMIGKIPNIENVEPMIFPFQIEPVLREDISVNGLSEEEIFLNVKDYEDRQVKVPKVVE